MRRARELLPLVPALLLVAIAANQVRLALCCDLDPWKGGGFGMFSTLDHASARRVRVSALWPEREEPVEIPDELVELSLRARRLPTEASLRALALATARAVGEQGPEPEAVRVRVERVGFDLARRARKSALLRELVVEIGP